MEIAYSLEISAPIEKVFDIVDENDEKVTWRDSNLIETIYTSEKDTLNPFGKTFTQKIREKGKIIEYNGEVTDYDKPNHLGVVIGNNQLSIQVDYHLTTLGNATWMDYKVDLKFHTWLAGKIGTLSRWFISPTLKKQADRLKKLAEC